MRKRITGAVAALAASAMLLAGCSGDPSGGGEAGSAGGSSLNIQLTTAPTNFNPFTAAQGGQQLTSSLIYDNLLQLGPDGEYQPRLAQEWEISDDAKTYTFDLIEDATWSDGEPFTAEDVVWTFNMYAHPEVVSAWSGRLDTVIGYDEFQSGDASELAGVTALDDHTVQIELTESNAGFLSLIAYGPAFYIMPKHVLGDVAPAEFMDAPFWTKPDVGMGPYVFEEYQTDQQVIVSANPNYRSELAIDTLYLKIVTLDNAAAQMVSGELDIAVVHASDADTVEATNGVTVLPVPAPGFSRFELNNQNPSLSDKRVRQALLHAMDRQGIIDGVLAGHAEILNTDIFPEWALPESGMNEYEYDPAKAKKLLEEAGYDFDDPIEIRYNTASSGSEQMVTAYIQSLAEAGITGVAVPTDSAGILEGFKDPDYDLILNGGGNYIADPSLSWPMLACDQFFPNGGNASMYCNEEFEALMHQGSQTLDETERAEIYKKAALVNNEDVPHLWIDVPSTIWAVSDKVEGFEPSGDATVGFFTAPNWTIAG